MGPVRAGQSPMAVVPAVILLKPFGTCFVSMDLASHEVEVCEYAADMEKACRCMPHCAIGVLAHLGALQHCNTVESMPVTAVNEQVRNIRSMHPCVLRSGSMVVHIMQMCIIHCNAGAVDQMHQCHFSAQWIPKILRSSCATDTTLCTHQCCRHICAVCNASNREALNVESV